MKKLILLAARNVFRNKRRSVITAMAIAFAVFIVINALSYVAGLYDGMVKVVLNTGIGHVQIHCKGFTDALGNGTVLTSLAMPENQVDRLLDNEEIRERVQKVSRRILFSGLLGDSIATTNGLVMGIDPDVERDFYKSLSVLEGRYLSVGDTNGILISKRIQHIYGFEVGNRINLAVRASNGTFETRDYEVVGVFDIGTDFNIRYIFDAMLNLDTARSLVGSDALTEVTLLLKDIQDTDSVVADLQTAAQASLLDVEVQGWRYIGKKLLDIATYIQVGMRVWTALIFVGVSLAILNTFLMSVFERTHEIGILKAIGMKRKRVLALILLETIILNLFASALALAISVISVNILSAVGLPSMVPGFLPKGEAVHPYIRLPDTVISLLIAMGISALAGLIPAWQASRMNPVDALRYE